MAFSIINLFYFVCTYDNECLSKVQNSINIRYHMLFHRFHKQDPNKADKHRCMYLREKLLILDVGRITPLILLVWILQISIKTIHY